MKNERFLEIVRRIRSQGDGMTLDQLAQLISRLSYDREMRQARLDHRKRQRDDKITDDVRRGATPLAILAKHGATEEDEDDEDDA